VSSEASVQREVWLDLSAHHQSKLFRLNTGKAWVSGAGPVSRLKDGSMLVPAGRPIALGFGLVNGDPVVGAADLIGWHTVRITPDMVGKDVAVFLSVETKRTKRGRTSEDQINWMNQVKRAGGIAGVANSVESARLIFDEWFADITQTNL
jgi:VRR-NUC domain